jgi:long-subunit fatty acid transport protein
MKGIFTLFYLFLSMSIHAQIGSSLVSSGRFSAMGKASVAVQGAEAVFSNPANLWGLDKMTVILASEWRYGVENLRPIALGFAAPSKSSVLGFTYQNFSFDTWRDNTLGVIYARKLMAKLDVGVHLRYQFIKIPAYESQSIIGFDLGFNALIINNLRLGFQVQNPFPFKLNATEIVPSVFRLGTAYQVNINVLVSLETVKILSFPAIFRLGMEYKFDKKWLLRGGYESNPSAFSFGLGAILSDHFSMDLALSNHAVLGLTPAITIAYKTK